MATPKNPITEGDLLALQLADAAVGRADRHLEAAKADRETVRARLRRRLPDREVVEIPGTGKGIKRQQNQGGRTFSITTYERAHGELTPEMAAIVQRGKGSEVWTIQELDV